MRKRLFRIEFVMGIVRKVFALGEIEAKILAQAEQIKEGKNYRIQRIYLYDELISKWVKIG